MNKYYIYEYRKGKFAMFKVIHENNTYTYGEYLFPAHLTGKRSSIMPATIEKHCYNMSDPNQCMKLCYRQLRNNKDYKQYPLKVGQRLYRVFFQNNMGEFLKFLVEYPEIQPLIGHLQTYELEK